MQKPVLISVPVVSTVPPKVFWSFQLYLYLELSLFLRWAIVALLGNLSLLITSIFFSLFNSSEFSAIDDG